MIERKLLAADVGTSSARLFLGAFDGERLVVEQRARFEHGPINTPRSCCWDLLDIYNRLSTAISGLADVEKEIYGFTLDAWGTDIVGVDARGDIVSHGLSTRDARFQGLKEEFFLRVPAHEIYARTGIQFLNWNTLFLVYSLMRDKPWLREALDKIMFASDYLLYLISGVKHCDYTIASTSQMLNPWTREWDEYLLKAAGLPEEKLDKPERARQIGYMREVGTRIRVYSGCGHDTAAAVAGIPAREKDFLYVILGSWAMMGTELDEPIVNAAAERLRFSNEGGVDGRIRFLKNSMGMWLIQESRREWHRRGLDLSYAQISAEGAKAAPWRAVIDVNDPRLQLSGDIPGAIKKLCEERGQFVPQTVGEVVRTINDSLAVKFAVIKKQIESCTGRNYSRIYVVAGGSQDETLCQAIADVTGCQVLSGPVEASACGNLSVQLIASGMVGGLGQTRDILRRSVNTREYDPVPNPRAEQLYEENCRDLISTVG